MKTHSKSLGALIAAAAVFGAFLVEIKSGWAANKNECMPSYGFCNRDRSGGLSRGLGRGLDNGCFGFGGYLTCTGRGNLIGNEIGGPIAATIEYGSAAFQDITKGSFVWSFVSTIKEATFGYIESASTDYSIIGDYCRLAMLSIEGHSTIREALRAWGQYPTLFQRAEIIACRIWWDGNGAHISKSLIVAIYEAVLESKVHIKRWLSAGICEIYSKSNGIIFCGWRGNHASYRDNPSPLGQFQGFFGFSNAPDTNYHEKNSSSRYAEMSVRNIFLKIGHNLTTLLLFVAGFIFVALALVCLSPASYALFRNVIVCWIACPLLSPRWNRAIVGRVWQDDLDIFKFHYLASDCNQGGNEKRGRRRVPR
jgi:hypothetical protein